MSLKYLNEVYFFFNLNFRLATDFLSRSKQNGCHLALFVTDFSVSIKYTAMERYRSHC